MIHQRSTDELEKVWIYKRIVRVITWLGHKNYGNRSPRIAFQASSSLCGYLRPFRIVKIPCRPCDQLLTALSRERASWTNLGRGPSPDPPKYRDPSCNEQWSNMLRSGAFINRGYGQECRASLRCRSSQMRSMLKWI